MNWQINNVDRFDMNYKKPLGIIDYFWHLNFLCSIYDDHVFGYMAVVGWVALSICHPARCHVHLISIIQTIKDQRSPEGEPLCMKTNTLCVCGMWGRGDSVSEVNMKVCVF